MKLDTELHRNGRQCRAARRAARSARQARRSGRGRPHVRSPGKKALEGDMTRPGARRDAPLSPHLSSDDVCGSAATNSWLKAFNCPLSTDVDHFDGSRRRALSGATGAALGCSPPGRFLPAAASVDSARGRRGRRKAAWEPAMDAAPGAPRSAISAQCLGNGVARLRRCEQRRRARRRATR